MAGDAPKYERLTRSRPRTRFGLVSTGNGSLWLGPDHLLCIDSSGYTENYKRFYFRDIQALFIRETNTYKLVALALVAFVGILGLVGFAVSEAIARGVIWS